MDELLHQTLKELHILHGYQGDETRYAVLLRATVKNILRLLDYSDKVYCELNFTVSSAVPEIKSTSWVYYMRRNSTPNSSENLDINAVQFFQDFVLRSHGHEEVNVLNLLTKILSGISSSLRPIRLKDSYSAILVKLSNLIEFFTKLRVLSEAHLVNFLCQCITYELTFYERLNADINLKEEDTENIVKYLDSFLKTWGDEDDSIFTYDVPRGPPLQFSSNNSDLQKIYSLFLNILSFKNFTAKDFRNYIKVLVAMFRKHAKLEFFELADYSYKEMKFNSFYDFFVGNSDGFTLLPHRYKAINDDVLLKFNVFPEMDEENSFQAMDEVGLETGKMETGRREGKEKGFSLEEELRSGSRQQDLHNTSKIHLLSTQTPHHSLSEEIPHDLLSEHTSYPIVHPLSLAEQAELCSNTGEVVELLLDFNIDLNPRFAQIFKHYMRLLYDTLPTFSNPHDLVFVNEVKHLVQRLMDFAYEDDEEDDYKIKIYIKRFQEANKWLSIDAPTMLARLAVVEFHKSTHLKKAILSRWYSKTLKYRTYEADIEESRADKEIELQRKLLKRWFVRHARFERLEDAARGFSSRRLLANVVEKWISRTMRNQTMYLQSNMKFLQPYFEVWAKKLYEYDRGCQQGDNIYSRTLVKNVFTGLVQKYINQRAREDEHSAMVQELISSKKDELVRRVWDRWYEKMNSNTDAYSEPLVVELVSTNRDILQRVPTNLSEKLNKLRLLEVDWIKQKYLKQWRAASVRSQTYALMKSNNEHALKTFFFRDLLLKKFKLYTCEREFRQKHDIAFNQQVLEHWETYTQMQIRAREFHREQTLRKGLKMWVLRHQLYKCTEDVELARTYFKEWHLRCQLLPLELRVSMRAKKAAFAVWKKRLEQVQQLEQMQAMSLRPKFLRIWVLATRNIGESEVVADIQFLRKFINKMRDKSDNIAQLERQDWKLRQIDEEILLREMLRKWNSHRIRKFDAESESKIAAFQSRIVVPNVKARFFTQWIEAFNTKQDINDDLESRCMAFCKGLLKRSLIQWKDKVSEAQDLVDAADNFRYASLSKRMMIRWYEKFHQVHHEFGEIADEQVYERDVRRVNEVFNHWTMRLTKAVRRNEQNYDIFVKKWNTARLRSIFNLWTYKQGERRLLRISLEALADVDDSMVSASSPLASRARSMRILTNSDVSEGLPNSYLYTPVKQLNRAPMTTPRTMRISPEKMQETSQRLRSERIDELRKHFGKARDSSTPQIAKLREARKESIPEDPEERDAANESIGKSTVESIPERPPNLSPIDPNSSRYIRLAPPPPNFVPWKEVSGSFSSDSVSHSILEDEQVVIENAKRLRRITPIMFPTEDDISEPAFSPINKIKERLRNRISPKKE